MSGTFESNAAGLRRLGRGIAGDAILVSILAAAVKIAGALKVVTMARAYGASDALDSFLAAFLVPSLVADTLANPLTSALVPAFVSLRESSGVDAAERMYQAVVGWVLTALAGFAALLALGSPWVMPLIASGFDMPKRAVTLDLLLLLLPLLPLGGLSVAYRARLNSSGEFAIAALTPAAVPLFTITSIFLFGRTWGVYALAWGTIAGGLAEVCVLGFALHRSGHRVLPRWAGKSEEMDGVFSQYIPVMAGTLLFGGAVLIDQALAARLKPGSVSALNLGTKLVTVFLGVAATGVGTATLPHLSRFAALGDWVRLRRTLRSQGLMMIGAATAGTLFLLLFSDAVVRFLFQSRAFTDEAAELVGSVQRAALTRVPFAIVLAMLLGLVSALRRNELMVRAAVLSFCLNVSLDLVAIQSPLGVVGIPIAGSITQAITASYLGWLVYRIAKNRAPEAVPKNPD